ncbi:P-type conjugative transfer ATPase TrbB [Robiginitomaculum antarcticum]|uniref:P-type conjugative transfer ATPase TrbB n=1 Tax=Robiginitomaculum antarcticum TaxID=437507 RepID=UPI00036E0779|nr:P-type conjugative transfer ATPase TrbB [Robiginitomaculum antarcticum]
MPPNNPVTAARTLDMLRSAMGPIMTAALDDPDIIEIMVNPDGALWFDRLGQGCTKSETAVTPQAAERIVRLVGSHINQDVTPSNPIVSAELPSHEGGGGERFEGILPPVVAAPSFAIRKKAVAVFTLGDYVEAGTMTPDQSVALGEAVIDRKNILIVGGTSSGKTTLANALLFEVAQTNDRVVILEDTRELQCEADDVVALRTHGLNVTLARLVRSTLRLRPDRVIVGEVRGPEALDMLKVWNTGHPGGIATVHANSAEAGLLRIEQLTLEAATNAPKALIAEAIDIVVFIAGRGAKRRVETVAMLTKLSGDGYELVPLKPKSPPTLTLVKET